MPLITGALDGFLTEESRKIRVDATGNEDTIQDARYQSETSLQAIEGSLWRLVQTKLPVSGPKRLRKSTTQADIEAEDIVDEEACDDDSLESQDLFVSFDNQPERHYC